MTGSARLRENIAWNVVGQGLVLVLSIVAVRLVFARLGGDVVGVVFFVLTLSPLLSTALDLGLSTTVVREVSRSHGRNAPHVRDLCRTVSTVCWILYGLGAVLVLLAAPLLVTRWVHLTSLDAGSAAMLLRLLGVGALTALPRAFYSAVLRGLQRMRYTNGIDVGMSVLQQGGTVFLLWHGAGSVQIVAWMAGCFWLATAAYVAAAAGQLGPRALLPGWSPAVIGRVRRFSGWAFAVSVLSVVSVQYDKLLVSKLLTVAAFGVYSFVASMAFRALVVSIAITLASWPALSSTMASGDTARLRGLYRRVQELQCLLAVPALALPLYALAPVAGYAFGRSAAVPMLAPLALLSLGFIAQIAITTPIAMVVANGSPGVVARASLLSLAVSAPVGAVATSRLGVTGAALYYLLYSLALCWLLVHGSARRFLFTTPGSWWPRTGRVLGAGLLVYGPPLALALRLDGSIGRLAVAYGLASALFLLTWAGGLMGDELRSSVLVRARRTDLYAFSTRRSQWP